MNARPDRPPTLRERKKQENMARLRAAARELMWEKGFDQVTTREIASHAQVGEATLFRYVASKIDLFMLVYGEEFEGVIARCEDFERDNPIDMSNPEHVLGRILDHYGRLSALYVRYPELAYTYVKESFGSPTEIGRSGLEHGDRFYAVLRGILGAAQRGEAFIVADPSTLAFNCHALYIHEVLRSHGRELSTTAMPDRLRDRLEFMLRPFFNVPRGRVADALAAISASDTR